MWKMENNKYLPLQQLLHPALLLWSTWTQRPPGCQPLQARGVVTPAHRPSLLDFPHRLVTSASHLPAQLLLISNTGYSIYRGRLSVTPCWMAAAVFEQFCLHLPIWTIWPLPAPIHQPPWHYGLWWSVDSFLSNTNRVQWELSIFSSIPQHHITAFHINCMKTEDNHCFAEVDELDQSQSLSDCDGCGYTADWGWTIKKSNLTIFIGTF